MSFRDEGEAQRERVESLERELAATRTALGGAQRELEGLPELRRKLGTLETENDALRRGVEPRVRTARIQLGFAIVLGVLTAIVLLLANRADQASANERIAALRAQLEETRAHPVPDPFELPARTTRAEAEAMAEAIVHAAIERPPITSRRFTHARVTAVEGETPVGVDAACVAVVLTAGPGRCILQVTCDGVAISAGERLDGTFGCVVDAGGPTADVDVDGSGAAGDHRVDLDVAEGSLVVSDPAEPRWSLTIALGAESRG